MKGLTHYGLEIEGDTGNYKYPVRFDWTDGYLGIDQYVNGNVDRVLLSPIQIKELKAFINRYE